MAELDAKNAKAEAEKARRKALRREIESQEKEKMATLTTDILHLASYNL